MKRTDWNTYYTKMSSARPNPLLVNALQYTRDADRALDLGGGTLRDAKYLLQQGFTHVDIVDNSTEAATFAANEQNDQISFYNVAFDQYNYQENTYDLVSSQWSLPFNPPETFDYVFSHTLRTLKPGGIFTGQFFGINDEWNSPDTTMTFLRKEKVVDFINEHEIIRFREQETDAPTASRDIKHWHIYYIILRKTK